jgi:hypothetical protein
MVKHICGGGLDVNLIKLNGRLELRFATDATHIVHHTIHGADTDDTVQVDHAREAAYGQPVMSLGLEMYLEEVEGILELTFEGIVGSTLASKHDGRQTGDMNNVEIVPENSIGVTLLHGGIGADEMAGSAKASRHLQEQAGMVRNATRDAKVQTLSLSIRNAKMQTLEPIVIHTDVQTRVRRTANTGVQANASTNTPSGGTTAQLFPEVVNLTGASNAITNTRKRRGSTISGEEAHTFTAAVATVFQSFNEPRDPYRVKRQAEPAADYRAYKHIFIEGYRSEDDKGEEGRLHIDLNHHVLIWETYDDCETGARLTLDRLKLPRCKFPCLTISYVMRLTTSRRGRLPPTQAQPLLWRLSVTPLHAQEEEEVHLLDGL